MLISFLPIADERRALVNAAVAVSMGLAGYGKEHIARSSRRRALSPRSLLQIKLRKRRAIFSIAATF
jgi:hypothetical protein